ncbi:protein of unknown function (DUF3425) [Geosmithia morbida]|uniref:BZIP transcription factor n=1 Tax=Geosmithia morbida TaxID=1094350 RepID=A0A9P4YVQ7_9HYPO|nr:protein of unknown function (DUF3425) [Geosmithia morbida]KAF4123720.1 protein of unknown function (DUF3425) [Geosmithia morbida]
MGTDSVSDGAELPTAADTVIHDDGVQQGRKRKRAYGTTTSMERGVARLTPEQLAKKRENDREAQRNNRRRTKAQIEMLQCQIAELTSQDTYQDFLAMKRAKEAVERENADIKSRLSVMMGDIQRIIGTYSYSSVERRRDTDAVGSEERPGLGFLLRRPSQGGAADDPAASLHARPVSNCGPTCPLDSLLLDFLSERRRRWADGMPARDVVGPEYPCVSSLVRASEGARSHPVSRVLTDILSTFPDISTLPERVAVLYVMFLVVRWQIAPTRDSYLRLPWWMRPGPAQLAHPHPAWIDHLPFPAMRDMLVRTYGGDAGGDAGSMHRFDDFFVPFTTTIRLNWPYEETDTLLQRSASSRDRDDGSEGGAEGGADDLVINPVFETHLRDHENWSLGEPFIRAFPSLLGTCKIDYSLKGAKGRG